MGSSSKPSRWPIRLSASATCSALTSSWRSYGSTCHGAPGWSATGGIRSGLGSLGLPARAPAYARAPIGARALALRDPRGDPVAGDRAADEAAVPAGACDARPAVGEAVDAQV